MKSVFLILAFCFISLYSFTQKDVDKPYYEGRLVFKVKPQYKSEFKSDQSFIKFSNQFNITEIEQMFPNSPVPQKEYNDYGQEMVDISTIFISNTDINIDIEQLANVLSANKMIEYAEPLYKVELLYVPDDPLNATDQYWLDNIRAYDAWDVHQGDTNIVIGISDTGCDLAHDDLIYNIKNNYNDLPDGVDNDGDGFVDNFRGWNFGENNNNVQADVNNHGIWVSGIAGASTDNGVGVSGAGFKCMLLPLKISNSDGILENSYQSIVYAAEHGVDVLNCSWGGTYYQRMAQDVVDYAVINHDMLVVSAAGNTDSKVDYYPSSYRNVLSVAGTTEFDERWSPDNSPTAPNGSSYSYYVDVCAPATMFKSTGAGSTYALMWGGTSFAAPIVSGCAGILRSAYPDYNANQIAELLKISADLIDTIEYNIPYAGMMGTGRVNLYNALTMEITPSILLQNYTVEQGDGYLIMDAEFINYLADASGLTINVSTESEYAGVETETIYTGDLNTLETYLSEDEIVVYFLEETPRDYLLRLDFAYTADDYSGSQSIELYINEGHKNISTQKLEMSVASNGRLGFSDVNSTIGDGLIFEEYFPLFYDCGIISGTSASQIFSSVRQSTDFGNIDYPAVVASPMFSDSQISLTIDDSNDVESQDIEVIQEAFAWNDEDKSNFIIVDYYIVNNGISEIEDFYFGLFNDWDLVEAANNSSELMEEEEFLYCYNNGAQNLYAGIKLLTDQEVNNYALAQVTDGDGIVDITDGFADIEKFYMISNTAIPESSVISDMVQYTGAGPFDISANDTVRVGFAIIGADNLYDLEQAVDISVNTYNSELHSSGIEATNSKKSSVFPNPAGDFVNIALPSTTSNDCELRIYNLSGKLVYVGNVRNNTKLDISFMENGLYKFEFYSGDLKFVTDVVVIK